MPHQRPPRASPSADGASDGPAVSVVVVALTGAPALDRCLAALGPQCAAVDGELIVAAPADVLRDQPDRARQVIVPGGWSLVRAAGVAAARGEVVVLTEDHCTPAPDWLAQLLGAHAQGVDVAGGPIRPSRGSPWMWAVYLQEYGRFAGTSLAPGRFSDCNVSYRRGVLEACRGAWWPSYHQHAVDEATLASRRSWAWVPEAVVTDERALGFVAALGERARLGREYGAARALTTSITRATVRLPLAPLSMTARALATTWQHGLDLRRTFGALPFAFLMALGWSWGEFRGAVHGAAP